MLSLFAVLCCAALAATGTCGRLHHSMVPPRSLQWPHYGVGQPLTCNAQHEDVFIGVLSGGTAEYRKRRDVARRTWMTWARDLGMRVTFFVDVPAAAGDQRSVLNEMMEHHDMVLVDRSFFAKPEIEHPMAPGSIWNRKAAWVLQYGLSRGNFTYLIRTDDDSFWCLHRLRFVLNYMPRHKFLMAHYFDNHTDVQIVASQDVAYDYVAGSQFGMQGHTWMASNFSLSPGVRICNDPSMTLGKHPVKGNLDVEGWLAPEELPARDRTAFCQRYLANHQSYPQRMQATYDAVKLWANRPCHMLYADMAPLNCRADFVDGSEDAV